MQCSKQQCRTNVDILCCTVLRCAVPCGKDAIGVEGREMSCALKVVVVGVMEEVENRRSIIFGQGKARAGQARQASLPPG